MHRRPYSGPHPADPAATAGLRRRLLQRTADRIEVARAEGDWQRVEELTAAHYARPTVKDRAAELARLPLIERMSMGEGKKSRQRHH